MTDTSGIRIRCRLFDSLHLLPLLVTDALCQYIALVVLLSYSNIDEKTMRFFTLEESNSIQSKFTYVNNSKIWAIIWISYLQFFVTIFKPLEYKSVVSCSLSVKHSWNKAQNITVATSQLHFRPDNEISWHKNKTRHPKCSSWNTFYYFSSGWMS